MSEMVRLLIIFDRDTWNDMRAGLLNFDESENDGVVTSFGEDKWGNEAIVLGRTTESALRAMAL
jgi:hypothetical protein